MGVFPECTASPLRRRGRTAGTVKLSRICPFCGRILLDQRLRINDLAVAAGGENAAKLLNLTVPANELPVSRRKEALVSAWSMAMTLIESGGEHMIAFVKAITEPMQPIACWTCIRSMLEPCARGAWLLDPAIDADTRIQRSFAIRFDGMEQSLKLARATNQPRNLQEKIENRIVDVERDAVAMGYPKLRDKKDTRIGIGVKMPVATELVKDILDAEEVYRILSAVSHGQAGAIRELSYTPVSGSGGTSEIGGARVTYFGKTVNPDLAAWQGLKAARTFTIPVWRQFTYAGWKTDPLRGLYDKICDRLQAGPRMRFWLRA